ncbi:MAG: L,D-transpeptidase, partial [Phycisphaerae bacterium]
CPTQSIINPSAIADLTSVRSMRIIHVHASPIIASAILTTLLLQSGCVSTGHQKASTLNVPPHDEWKAAIAKHSPDLFASAQALVIVAPVGISHGRGWFCETDPEGKWNATNDGFPISVGIAGIAAPGEKREGDKRTPSGVFRLTEAFGRDVPALAGTKLRYRQATKHDAWSEDIQSPDYNTWISGDRAAAATDRLLRDDGLYDQSIVVDYNRDPVEPGRGSAIFIHRAHADGTGTLGCIALDATDLDFCFSNT